MLQPLEDGFKVLTQFEENKNIPGAEFYDKNIIIKLSSTIFFFFFFETGSEVLVKLTK